MKFRKIINYSLLFCLLFTMFVACNYSTDYSKDYSNGKFTIEVNNETVSDVDIVAKKYSGGSYESKCFSVGADSSFEAWRSDSYEGDIQLFITYNGEKYTTEDLYVDKILNGLVFTLTEDDGVLFCKCSEKGLKLLYKDYKVNLTKQ